MSYIHTLVMMNWRDTGAPTIGELARQLREYKGNLASSMWACVLAVGRLTQKVFEQGEKGRCSSCTPIKASAVKSQPFSVQGKEYQWCTPLTALWFFLHDPGEEEVGWRTYLKTRGLGIGIARKTNSQNQHIKSTK